MLCVPAEARLRTVYESDFVPLLKPMQTLEDVLEKAETVVCSLSQISEVTNVQNKWKNMRSVAYWFFTRCAWYPTHSLKIATQLHHTVTLDVYEKGYRFDVFHVLLPGGESGYTLKFQPIKKDAEHIN